VIVLKILSVAALAVLVWAVAADVVLLLRHSIRKKQAADYFYFSALSRANDADGKAFFRNLRIGLAAAALYLLIVIVAAVLHGTSAAPN